MHEPPPGRALAQRLLILEPQFRERVWGGRRLRPGGPPIGEAWIAYGDSTVARGPLTGARLDDLRARHGTELVGEAVVRRYPGRWPLLIKLLDCADWLSIQVHPNDEQARRLAGPGQSGKTEAWYVVDAAPGARILMGVKPDVSAAELAAAIRRGRAIDAAAEVPAHAGEAVLIPAGTLHSVGPGLLLYEIQQQSDITYRAYDWDRPQSAGRSLHIEESAAVTTADPPQPRRTPRVPEAGGLAPAVDCPYFRLELGRAAADPLLLGTEGRSFHVLTAIDGAIDIVSGAETVRLDTFETALVAAGAGRYVVAAAGDPATFLRASVPD